MTPVILISLLAVWLALLAFVLALCRLASRGETAHALRADPHPRSRDRGLTLPGASRLQTRRIETSLR